MEETSRLHRPAQSPYETISQHPPLWSDPKSFGAFQRFASDFHAAFARVAEVYREVCRGHWAGTVLDRYECCKLYEKVDGVMADTDRVSSCGSACVICLCKQT